MNRRLFIFVIVLMGISLAGIILLQLFWIRNAISIRDENFNKNVNAALRATAGKLESHENIMILGDEFTKFRKSVRDGDSAADVFIMKADTVSAGAYSYAISSDESANYVISVWTGRDDHEVVEYKHEVRIDSIRRTVAKVRSSIGLDSLDKMITHDLVFIGDDGDTVIEGPENGYLIIKRANDLKEAFIRMAYEIETEPVPISDRIDPHVLLEVLTAELLNKGISAPFEFAVMNLDSTKSYPIRSSGFIAGDADHKYMVSIFPNELVDESNFLVLQFPGRNVHIVKSMAWILASALLLTLVIVITFGITIHMILRQKKLSDIKSDFINNMTHEFKTPIATISLAVDAIDNPRIIRDEDEVRNYTAIIREENQRMNTQVENVLRMSLLEKHDMEFNIREHDLHALLLKAVDKAGLLLRERDGMVSMDLKAMHHKVFVDADHFTNAVLNLLDNAIKYSTGKPVIAVSTADTDRGVLIRISDQGMGMSRDVQQRIFDKFYRKESGNIHNIKGFGLGLSYVKAVVEAFGGTIRVQSEPRKGSTFEIIIPNAQ